ncbi:MAG: hypothetical protein Q7R91_02350 [bacterium]|nr:hypothetical protein [bacterium]
MRRLVPLLLLAFFSVHLPVFAADDKPKNNISWRLRDLYYHDANGTIVQLELARKLLVRFTREISNEEKTALLAEFSPIAQKEQPGNPSRIVFSFNESTSLSDILDAANKITASGNAEASLVFFVDNIEAVLEGVVIEPKIVLTPDRLKARMQKYGGFTLRQAVSENGSWIFLIDEVKPPLNLLVLTNLISNDIWVRRAYPRFKFLHDPIVASINVEPVSGTIGETRTIIFTVKIFDSAITLSTEYPEFGAGLFRPIQGSPSSPLSIRHVPGHLFELVGDPVRHPVKQEKRSRVYTTSWKFKHYAVGEWVIHPLTVPYTKNGVAQEIKSSGFTLVVNSQIGNLNITDMPNPRSLIYFSEKSEAPPIAALPPVPSYWFDAWTSHADIIARYAGFAGMLLGTLPVAGAAVLVVCVVKRNRKKARERRYRVKHIEELLQEAYANHSYAKYDEALSFMFAALFPDLPLHPAWEDVKNNDGACEVFGGETMAHLEMVFGKLSRRYASNFTPSTEDIMKLHESMCSIFDTVKRVLKMEKEVR